MEKRIALKGEQLKWFLYVKYGLYTPSLKINKRLDFLVTRLWQDKNVFLFPTDSFVI